MRLVPVSVEAWIQDGCADFQLESGASGSHPYTREAPAVGALGGGLSLLLAGGHIPSKHTL